MARLWSLEQDPCCVCSQALPAQRPERFSKVATFDHAAAVSQLKTLHTEAQIGLRKVVALGLFCFELKEVHLKHGQFGPWLQECAPELCKLHSKSKAPHPSSVLARSMSLTEGVLKAVGGSVRGALAKLNPHQTGLSYPPQGGICHGGELLLLSNDQVPEAAKQLHGKICSMIDGKTAKQLFFEFKQAEEDSQGNTKPKVGRLKGQGGATKDQRAAKAATDAQAEKLELELAAKDLCKLIKTNCLDDKWGTKLPDAALQAVNDWCKAGFDYTVRILNARKKGPAAQ